MTQVDTMETPDRATREIGPVAHRVTAGDGVELALARYVTQVTHRVPVLLTHGTFSNGTLCSRLAAYLAQQGFDCWVLDLRGHGESQRDGFTPDFEAFGLFDTPAAIGAVRRYSACPEIFLVGHSAGGLAFLMHLARRPEARREVVGVITLASQATGAYTTWQGWAAGHGVQVGTAVLGYSAGRAWRLGPEDERKGVFDAWFRWNRTQRWTGADGFDYMAALGQVTVPVWCFAGAGDRAIAPAEGCRRVYEAIGSPGKRWTVCGRAEGFSEDFNHARIIASRAAQREIWPRIKDWLVFTETMDGV
jgi:oxygen-independent coproporphyrinogen-3 oxidase